ncbi:DNA mismatch repair endonuclease MutL [Blattabacterium sp. (Blaberus giganteus)]|uniref:DNA mismatch repair endonuclease MutL n=1 Tax=Blattabacterium sp. (Blaberus giganteus) TaxID=1186051 RepID=UPI00025F6E53|nr:DNA mismatch repair endonuclease MutL [Blattabacterium sp. (Blaberus giganteus)]AFJ90546.1 DNA mismatch repair protein MutL [Blattabacterium sp. (Blaberus giganteus)]
MKNIIQFLPEKVIQQIAAGEVIHRPSSILRELLENAIDANAKMIDIFINDSGTTLIQLIDDGIGMSIDDAKMSIQRYTTSKIQKYDDIFRIKTKGFRGEALASIALISQLEIQTKNEKDAVGIHLIVEEGKIKKQIPINMLKGTRISVKNIFFKLPARRKFLKSYRIEFKHIIYEFYKIVLAHRNITYRFYHNDKIIFHLKKTSLIERIKEIFRNKRKNLVPIFVSKNRILVEGFVSVPDISIKKGDQFLLINQRCVTHLLIHKKIIHAYDGFLRDLKTVSYFIFIFVDSNLVNWNLHPAKKEVKLEEEETIGEMIQQEIKNILFYQYKVKNNELKNYDIFLSCQSFKKDYLFCDKFSDQEKIIQLENWFHKINESNFDTFNNDFQFIKELSHYVSHKEKIKTIQMNRKYIIFVLNNEYMILVDQHKAHQNILFEFFFLKKNLISQQFIFPIKVKLLKKEFISLNNIKNDLINFGFHLYICKKSAYLYSVPENIQQNMLVEIIQNIITYNFIQGKKNNKERLIQIISKSASIKYGTKLYPEKMEYIIKNLFSCHNPNYTYSGDPIFFVLSKNLF